MRPRSAKKTCPRSGSAGLVVIEPRERLQRSPRPRFVLFVVVSGPFRIPLVQLTLADRLDPDVNQGLEYVALGRQRIAGHLVKTPPLGRPRIEEQEDLPRK